MVTGEGDGAIMNSMAKRAAFEHALGSGSVVVVGGGGRGWWSVVVGVVWGVW